MHETAHGRCDFIDVLEESVVIHQPVTVALRDGVTFIDQVKDVVTESGEDYVQFQDHGRMALTRIVRCQPTPKIDLFSGYDAKL
jgi:Rho-binding antiterminator